jgi:hypothetical protein
MGNATWWQRGVIYQIYPRSFMDGDGDGVGDLRGILARLDHLTWLGVDAIWLSPVHPSPMDDFGYDVSDFLDVDPVFGTLADLDELVAAAHARGCGCCWTGCPTTPPTGTRGSRSRAPRATTPGATGTSGATPGGRPAHQLAALHRRQRLALGRAHRPVLLPRVPGFPARPELAQPAGAGGHARHAAFLAGQGGRRVPDRRADGAGRGRPAARQPAQPPLPAGPGPPLPA